MTIWEFVAHILLKVVDFLEAFDIFWGISAWTFILIAFGFADIGFIISAIFQSKPEKEGSDKN